MVVVDARQHQHIRRRRRDHRRDRLGLLYELTSALTRNRLQISSAHISTFGERVVDVFYVRDSFGLKVQDEARLTAIHTALMEAAAGDGPTDEATALVANAMEHRSGYDFAGALSLVDEAV